MQRKKHIDFGGKEIFSKTNQIEAFIVSLLVIASFGIHHLSLLFPSFNLVQ